MVWLAEYRQNGLSVKQFCELIEVSVATFYNWQRRLNQPTATASEFSSETSLATSVSFAGALIPISLVSDKVEIRLPAGGTILLPNEASSLKPILQALAEVEVNS